MVLLNILNAIYAKFKKKEEKMISFDILNAIYAHLYYESSSVNFKMNDFFDKIYLNRYSFPESFDDKQSKSLIESCGLSSSFEVLNSIYSRIDIDPLDLDSLADDASYDFIHIQFYSDGKPYSPTKKHIIHNFIIFFCCENGSLETNSYRIMYQMNNYFTSYISSLFKTKSIEESDIKEEAMKDFETVLIGICQYLQIDLPSSVSTLNLLPETATQAHFEELLTLVTRNALDAKITKKQAKKMFNRYKNHSRDHWRFAEDNWRFFDTVNMWHSDWKFDVEDVLWGVSEMIGKDFSFDYPEETYSDDLFPYIQEALSRDNLELMSFDTQADSYLFFVANKKDISRISKLAQIVDLQVDSLQ